MRRARIIGVQVAIAVVLLEAGLRVYNPLPFRLKGETIVLPVREAYQFDNRGTRKLDAVTRHTKNSLGFRGPDPPSDPREFDRQLTVLTIGGSTTESLFLSDGKTWTDVLSRHLSAIVPDVWVNNAGLDGQSTYGHLVLLQSVVTRLRPKVALFLVGINDVALDRANTFDSALTPARSRLHRLQVAVLDHSAVASTAQNIYRAIRTRRQGFGHSDVDLRAARRVVFDEAEIRHVLDGQAPYLDQYRARLIGIAQLCQANQIAPVFITQPALFGETVDPATGVDLATVQVNGRGNGTVEWRLLERYNDVTRRIGHEAGILVIDLAREMPKDSRLFYDFLHYTNDGSVVVGDTVFRALCPDLVKRFSLPAVCPAAAL
jgi:lysophospholipase L1-like esterase